VKSLPPLEGTSLAGARIGKAPRHKACDLYHSSALVGSYYGPYKIITCPLCVPDTPRRRLALKLTRTGSFGRRTEMPVIVTLGVLGAAIAFLLFVLVGFWREGTSRERGREHVKVTPFCMACAEGWPHELNRAGEEVPAVRFQSRVLEMPSPAQNSTEERTAGRSEKRPVSRGVA
jgi:hypothetical protein